MSLSATVSEKANLIWAIADKLTGTFKPHQYGEIILTMTVLRRFDNVFANAGAGSEKEEEALSEVIKGINERFRTEFAPRDKVKPLMQIRDTFRRDSRFVTLAREGDMKNLEMLYEAEFKNKVVEECESNREFFDRIAADGSLLNAFKEGLWRFVVTSLTRDAA